MISGRNSGSRLCIAALFTLSGCGPDGGSGSGGPVVATPTPAPAVVPTPTPTPTPEPTPPVVTVPTPTPTPTPTPPVAVQTSELKPDASSPRISVSQAFTLASDGNSTSDRSIAAPGTPFSLTYDPSTKTYAVSNTERSRQFSPSEFYRETKPDSEADRFPRVEYRLLASTSADFLNLFEQTASNPPIPIIFSAWGVWQHSENLATGTRVRYDYFSYGTVTPIASIPNGQQAFRWAGTANAAKDQNLYFAYQSGLAMVDYNNKSIYMYIVVQSDSYSSGGSNTLLAFECIATINGNTFSGPLIFPDKTYAGTLSGQFYGAHASELGFVFSLANPTLSITGAAAGTTS